MNVLVVSSIILISIGKKKTIVTQKHISDDNSHWLQLAPCSVFNFKLSSLLNIFILQVLKETFWINIWPFIFRGNAYVLFDRSIIQMTKMLFG